MNKNGYIKIYRSLTSWEWYSEPNTLRLFLHLLLTVNYEDKKWCGEIIRRGQRVSSYSELASELNLSVRNIRTALNHLKSTGEVTHTKTSKYGIFTVNNYDEYQTLTPTVTVSRQSADSQPTVNRQQRKKDNKYKNIYSGGSDNARARAREEEQTEDDSFDFPENVQQHYETMKQIEALPADVRERFYQTVDSLFASVWGRAPSEFEYSQIYSLLRWLHYSKENGWQPVEMTEDDVGLLSHSFEAAANADKKFLAYVRGVFQNYKLRGIETVDDLIDFDIKRDHHL